MTLFTDGQFKSFIKEIRETHYDLVIINKKG